MRLTRLDFVRRSAMLLASVAIVGGCTDFSSSPTALGHLIVTAKDPAGAPVQGMNFTALANDRSTEWAKVSTSSDGTAEFRSKDKGILPQVYVIRFEPGGGYQLAPGETNDKTSNVVAGQTNTVNFIVSKPGVGGLPGG
jgi:hypothetical protein